MDNTVKRVLGDRNNDSASVARFDVHDGGFDLGALTQAMCQRAPSGDPVQHPDRGSHA